MTDAIKISEMSKTMPRVNGPVAKRRKDNVQKTKKGRKEKIEVKGKKIEEGKVSKKINEEGKKR